MNSAKPTADDERLPWLESSSDERAVKRGRSGWKNAVLLALLAALLGAAIMLGYLLALPRQAPRPEQPGPVDPTVSIPLEATAPPVTELEVLAEPAAQPVEPSATPAIAAIPAPPVEAAKPPAAMSRPRTKQAAKDSEEPKPEADIAPPIVWQPPPSAGPTGRVIQLGAFGTARQADRGWRQIIRRYPYLGTKAKVVVPTTIDSDGKKIYRLQLGTASQAQSLVICQYLAKRAQNCEVVY